MRRIVIAVLLAISLLASVYVASAKAIVIKDRITVPFTTTAIACNGELVTVSGELLLMSHTTFDAQGGIHSKFTLVPQHVRGVGSVTGIEYKAVGGARNHFNADADFAPLNVTDTSMFNLISQGGTENLQAKFTFHITVNAKGELTADVFNFSTSCDDDGYPTP